MQIRFFPETRGCLNNRVHRAALYHRHLVVYCENCTCNSHFKPLDSGIEAQPNGAVETVPLKTRSIGLRFTIAI